MSPTRPSLPRPRPPLWVTWVLSLMIGAVLLVALVLFVNAHNTNSTSHPADSAELRQAAILIAQDQEPHMFRLASGGRRYKQLVAAVAADIDKRIRQGLISGTLQHVRCLPSPASGGRVELQCVATVSDVNYDYTGVIDAAARTVTYCRRDVPPVPTMRIPLSPACQA